MEFNDEEFAKLLGAKTAAIDQLRSETANVAAMLGQFRAQLIAPPNNFTTNGAEDLTREWFIAILDGSPPAEDE